MSIEHILFILRLISALTLLGILATLFIIIWKTYNQTIKQIQSTRQIYGRLVVLREIDGTLMVTGETHPPLSTNKFRACANQLYHHKRFVC